MTSVYNPPRLAPVSLHRVGSLYDHESSPMPSRVQVRFHEQLPTGSQIQPEKIGAVAGRRATAAAIAHVTGLRGKMLAVKCLQLRRTQDVCRVIMVTRAWFEACLTPINLVCHGVSVSPS